MITMPKKKNHKYKMGTEVKFRYFDGSIHTGAIVKQTYNGENWDHLPTNYKDPLYTIQVASDYDSRGFMLYPSVGEHRIIESNGVTNKNYTFKKEVKVVSPKTIKSKFNDTRSELDDAIKKQKEFIEGKVKN